jgi:hypothetical protein
MRKKISIEEQLEEQSNHKKNRIIIKDYLKVLMRIGFNIKFGLED